MDHYQTLGVAKTATPDEIKKAYRKLASQHHPDKGGDTATFQKIQTAYDTLSDPNKRRDYDNPQPSGFNGFPGGFHFGAGPAGFEDLFEMFNRHQQRRPQTQTYRTNVLVTMKQVYYGEEHTMRIQTNTNTHMVKINVPKGVNNGDQIRLDNVIEGASLIVEFRVQPDLKYERRGADLYCNHSISVLDLIVGTEFEFTTISGKTFAVSVKPRTQPFMQLKITGQGMPIPNSNEYGDQIILLKPFIPDTIDSRIIDSIMQSKTKE